MAEKKVRVCDFPGCGKDESVLPAFVMVGNKEWGGDLCNEHQSPLKALMRPIGRKRTDRQRVWTMEEIEDLRKET